MPILLIDVVTILQSANVTVYSGYAFTEATAPYIVVRPLAFIPDTLTLSGTPFASAESFSVYCCGASVEASFNLALSVMSVIADQRIGGYVPVMRINYTGAEVQGLYETNLEITMETGG